jgi:hypothetical protein
MDPHGYAVPLGAHIRRMNPRDTAVAQDGQSGAIHGPPSPEGALEDGGDRGIAAVRDMRQPRPPIRVRAKRLGK